MWYIPYDNSQTREDCMMKQLQRQSPLPLYYQLKEKILALVDDGVYKAGDLIPSERELCEKLHISRMTARKAISTLVNEGVLYREQGRGTFVATPKPPCTFSKITGFSENLQDMGLTFRTEIIDFRTEEATRGISERLCLSAEDSKVFYFLRRRFVGEEPFSLEHAWVPAHLFPGFTRKRLEGDSYYRILQQEYGYRLSRAKQTIEPVLASEFEASALLLEANTPILLFQRQTWVEEEVVVEYTKCLYRGKRFKYEMSLGV